MKKTRILAVLLLIILILLSVSAAFSLSSNHSRWPEFSGSSEKEYISKIGYVHFSGIEEGCRFTVPDYMIAEIAIPSELSNTNLQVDYFTKIKNIGGYISDSGEEYGEGTLELNRRIESISDSFMDYLKIQYWRFYEKGSNRSIILPVIAIKQNPENDAETIDKLEAYTDRAEKLVSVMKAFNRIYDEISKTQNAASVKIGSFHPSDINLLCKVANAIQTSFDITIGYFDTHTFWVEGDGWNDVTAGDIINHWTNYKIPKSEEPLIKEGEKISQNQIDKLDRLLDIVAPYWINYLDNHRIEKPEITRFEVDGSKGLVDALSRTVTLRLPADTDWNSLSAPIIETSGEALFTQFAGSLASGEVLYQVTPGDRATGTYYNGKDSTGYGFGVDLSTTWKVVVEEGTPYNRAFSFMITTEDGKDRYATITEPSDDSDGRISLNLPYGTDLSKLSPVVNYAGEGYYFTVNGERLEQGAQVDFTKDIKLVVYNTAYDVETVYAVALTADKSSENSILYYMIDGAEGAIEGDTISITIPYATDLASIVPFIEISEFAQLTGVPDSLVLGNNEYIVTAEDGTSRTYTVIISRAAASKEKNILSFKYGGYSGVINNSSSTVSLTIPQGISTIFAPEIEVSEFATIDPASGKVQDFSSPVKYKVKAQNGSSKIYTVTVTVQETDVPNEYKDSLRSIVDKIISRYRTQATDDWEWMDLGLYERLPENYNEGSDHSFDIARELSTLDTTTSVGMTEYARTVMMLTARGFNCSNLAQYNNGTAFKDSKGNDVDDLVNAMYSFSGSYTINGPAFTLIALDMGNYTVPEDAVWTRERLLDVLLSYTGDEFGIDMVGALMYSIAPYQDDPVYGSRVNAKLNACLEKVLSSMNSDYSFGAWGATNSESAAWVMMGLCSMGIDWHVDPRFSDGQGHSALQHWMDNFANVQEGYFHHTTSVRNNYMATYEGCYSAMWYLGFLDNGGAGHPYSLYYHRFDFSTVLSNDASILSFELEGKQGVIEEDEENRITVTLSNGMPLTNMKPEIELAEGAKLIAPSLPVTFVEGVPQPFTVCAEDGKTHKTYFVTVVYDDVLASGAELDVDSLVLQNSVLNDEAILSKAVITASDGATEILLTVKPGVNTAKMYLSADVSYAAVCDPVLDGSKQMDLSDWLTVTITSEDGTNTNVYRIKVVAKDQAEITSFEVKAGGTWYSGTIDNTSNTITVRDVDDSKLTSTVLETRIVFTGLTCSPTSGVATNFASSVTYTLGGSAELASRSYTVNVLNKSGQHITAGSGSGDTPGGADDPSGPSGDSNANGARILGLTVLGKEAVIDQDAGTITVTLPKGTDVSAVALDITLSEGASSDPSFGQIVDLSMPLTITVRNGVETRQYVISVVLERSISEKLWDEMLEESDVIDHQISHGRGIH